MTITQRKAFRMREALKSERERYAADGKKHSAAALSEVELNLLDVGLARLYDLIVDTGVPHQ